MKIERVKELVEQVKRHVPEGGKFSVYGHATLVLEGVTPECEFVAFVVDIPTHFHMRKIYGDMESRLEGEWVGNSEVRIYTGYSEARVKMVGDIPCRHEAHPDFDATALDNLGVDSPSRRIRKLADILADGMSVEDGQINFTDESIHDAMNAGLKRSEQRPVMEQVVKDLGITRRTLETSEPFTGRKVITATEKQRNDPYQGHDTLSSGLTLTDKNVDVADAVGDYLGLGGLVDDMMESRSASKALLQNPTSLRDTPQGMSQLHRRNPFFASEYRGRLVQCSEEQLKLTVDDPERNRRQYNSASLRVKVTYKRRLQAWANALGRESLTAQCTVTQDSDGRWLSRRTPIVVEVKDESRPRFGPGLARKQIYGTPLPPRELFGRDMTLEDHSVDSIAVVLAASAKHYVPAHEPLIDLGPLAADGNPQLPKEVQDTIEKFIGDEDKKEDKE